MGQKNRECWDKWGAFSSRGESLGWIVVSSPKITFPRPIRSCIVKVNYISLVVSEILRYGQTNIQTDILLHIIVPGDISGFVDNLTSRLRDISTKLFVLISVLWTLKYFNDGSTEYCMFLRKGKLGFLVY